MAPKRSREVTTEVSQTRPRSKPRVSQLLNITAASELFALEVDFKCYTEFFHGRDLVAGRRFSLSTLTTTGLEFEEKNSRAAMMLSNCETHSLDLGLAGETLVVTSLDLFGAIFEEKWDLERNRERRRTPNVENREQGFLERRKLLQKEEEGGS